MSPKLYQVLSMKVTTCIFILAYASFPFVGSTITALLDTRQAIPVAMVQSKALTGHAIANKTKPNTGWCNRTSPYCDPFITHQYKLDQEMKNIPSSFNITDSTYNASIVHALASNKTTVTRNKTIVFLQNQGGQKASIKPPIENFQTLKELTNYTIPLSKTISNRTIYIPPYGNLKTPAVQDQTQDVPFSQAVESGKIYIPSFVNKAFMPVVEQTNTSFPFTKTSNDAPLYTNRNNTYIPEESGIPVIQNFLGPKVAPYLFNQTSNKVPVIRIEVRTNSPWQSAQSSTEPTNITSPLNQTSDKGESSITSYMNNSSGYMSANGTDERNMPMLENVKISAQDNVSFAENSTRYIPSTSNNTYTDMIQEKGASGPLNTEHLAQLNNTLRKYGLYIPSSPAGLNTLNISSNAAPNVAPASRRSILNKKRKRIPEAAAREEYSKQNEKHYIKASIRRDMEVTMKKHKEIKRKKMERRSKVYPYKRSKLGNQFHFIHPYSRRRRGGPTIEVSVSKDLETTNHRVKRYVFDYDSNNEDFNELPDIFSDASYIPSPPLVSYEIEDPATNHVKTSRSDISRTPQDSYEQSLFSTDYLNNGLVGPNLIDTNANRRGRIEIPDTFNYGRSLPPIGEPAKRMIDQLLSSRPLDRTMDNDFFRLGDPNQENRPYGKPPPKWESPTLRDDISRYDNLNSKADANIVPRSEQDKLKEEEMGKILDKFDRQTQKIANLYKYFEPGDTSRDGINYPHAENDKQESQHYELNDPQNTVRSTEESRGWGSPSYHPDPPNTDLTFEVKHDPQDIVRSAEEGRGWGSSSNGSPPKANLVDEVKHDPQNIVRNAEQGRRWVPSSYHPGPPNINVMNAAKHDRVNLREGTELNNDRDSSNLHGDGQDHSDLRTNTEINNNNNFGRRNLVGSHSEPVQYNRDEIMRELLNYVKKKQEEATFQSDTQAVNLGNQLGDTRASINMPHSIQEPSMAETDNNRNLLQLAAVSSLLKSASAAAAAYKDPSPTPSPILPLQDSSMDFPSTPSYAQSGEKKQSLEAPGGQDISEPASYNSIANEKGVVMLLIATPKSSNDEDETVGRKEVVEHKELTTDGVKRVRTGIEDNGDKDKGDDDDDDFSKNLKEATNLVLGDELKAGNITTEQRNDIEEKLGKILDIQHKNKTTVDQYIDTKDKNVSISTAIHDIAGDKKSKTPKAERRIFQKLTEAPPDAVMYLSFESTERRERGNRIPDKSGNHNSAIFEDPAGISKRVLGTCGKAAEINDGSITWRGSKFRRKPEKAVTVALWVKVKKGGVINWFANGKEGSKMFETKSKGIAVPAKVWTHVAGTFDSETGLARIYINGNIEEEKRKGSSNNLSQNWLVNGIGGPFGDDSIQYVDELFIYDRALNSSEVQTLASRCIFNRMIVHYGFQDGNKTNVHDQSGLENNGILIGGALIKHECNRCGYCADLQSGPNPSLKIQQISIRNLPRVKVTIAVWISLNDTKGVHNIFTTESGKGNIGYQLAVKNGKVRWYIASDKGHTIFDNITKNVVVPESLWTHIIVSYNNENGVVSIYSNSILKFKDKVPESRRKYLPINWDNDASIGDSSYHGYLDEFIMYNWELDSSEVLYVRNYCADHPKLVRFTVRVPLTKKAVVPASPKKPTLIEPKPKPQWWAIYKKLLDRKKEVTRRTLTTLRNFQQSLSTAYPLLK